MSIYTYKECKNILNYQNAFVLFVLFKLSSLTLNYRQREGNAKIMLK